MKTLTHLQAMKRDYRSDERTWTEECTWISNATQRKGIVSECNNDKACFLRYCIMQRDTATHDKFFDAAEYIQQCIDELEGNK